mmetsp:Transcript_3866/g.11985  ORF Transcript_3866/g.11985 Transcript_3866/m.11985 type:complete len:211 (-) Transcript_3866:611-1243(-)
MAARVDGVKVRHRCVAPAGRTAAKRRADDQRGRRDRVGRLGGRRRPAALGWRQRHPLGEDVRAERLARPVGLALATDDADVASLLLELIHERRALARQDHPRLARPTAGRRSAISDGSLRHAHRREDALPLVERRLALGGERGPAELVHLGRLPGFAQVLEQRLGPRPDGLGRRRRLPLERVHAQHHLGRQQRLVRARLGRAARERHQQL